MPMPADRAVFFEYIRENPITLTEIVELFNVSYGTARNWSKHPEVEHIPGSYPHVFRHKTSVVIPGLPPKVGKKNPTNGKSMELPDVSQDQLQGFFEKLMGDEANPFHFNQEFRSVDSIAAINELERKLISCLLVTHYYRDMMLKDGVK